MRTPSTASLHCSKPDLRRGVRVGLLLAPRPPELDRHADRAVAEVLALGGEREHVGHEELRHALLVVVVDLRGAVDPRVRRPHRRLRLTDDQREPVAPQHQIEPLLDPALLEGDLGRDHPLVRRVVLRVVEVDQPDRGVLAVRAERHRFLPGQPGHELLVGHHRMRARAGGNQDRPQLVDDLVSLVRVRLNLRVEPNQRLLDAPLEHHLVETTRKLVARHELDIDRLHEVAHEVTDRVGLVELRHQLPPKISARRDARKVMRLASSAAAASSACLTVPILVSRRSCSSTIGRGNSRLANR